MSLSAVLFFAFGWLGANLLKSSFISPYFSYGGGTLGWHLAVLAGWLGLLWFESRKSPDRAKHQFWLVLIFVALFVGTAFIRQLNLRTNDDVPLGIHDGAIHVEVAAEKLLRGGNPYTADYRDTEYRVLNPPIPGGPSVNVVWSHFIYPPATFLVQAPWTWVGQVIGFRSDIRWILFLAFAIVCWWLARMQATWEARTKILILTAGNPLLWLYVMAGYNDILFVATLIASAWATQRRQWWVAGMAFGLSLGFKQSAWLLVPVFVWMAWQYRSIDKRALRHMLSSALITALMIFGPFLIWNAGALYDDIVRYASGAIPYSYPISGATFLQYLRIWGWIESPWTVVSISWLQFVVGIPFIGWAMYRLKRELTPATWLSSSAAVIVAVLLVSRYNNNNYLSGILLIAIATYAFQTARAHA